MLTSVYACLGEARAHWRMGLPSTVAAIATAALVFACAAQPSPERLPPLTRPPPPTMRILGDLSASCGIPGVREEVLQRVNAIRAAGRSCGNRPMPPAPPLRWDEFLFSAAARHSSDMAARDYFNHANPEGQRAGARARAQGYAWRSIGENIAGGDRSVEVVIRGWMDSPGHCRNIMNPDYADVAVACVERIGSTWGTYWTMVLGRPR